MNAKKKNLALAGIAVLLVAVLAVAAVLYQKFSAEYAGENLGSTEEAQLAAPDFTVLDSEGNEVQLSDYVGKPIVLNFWATWCYYCKEEMPDFDKAYEAYPEVQFLMVNATDGVQETMESAQEYIQQEGFQFDVFYDTQLEAVNAYYVTGFPATYFIDAQGNLVTRSRGMLDYNTLVKGIGMITE